MNLHYVLLPCFFTSYLLHPLLLILNITTTTTTNIIILQSLARSSKLSLPFRFSDQNIVYIFHSYVTSIPLDMITRIISGELYILCRVLSMQFSTGSYYVLLYVFVCIICVCLFCMIGIHGGEVCVCVYARAHALSVHACVSVLWYVPNR
jgi:hypothetical protein